MYISEVYPIDIWKHVCVTQLFNKQACLRSLNYHYYKFPLQPGYFVAGHREMLS